MSSEQPPGHQQMHVGMSVQEIPGTLQARDGARNGGAGSCGDLEKILDSLIRQPGVPGEALATAEERPEAPWQRYDGVAMGHCRQALLADELAEGRLALGMAGGTEAALLAREREEVLVAALGAADADKAQASSPQR